MKSPPGGHVAIGDLVLFRFEVTNASSDLNWIANVTFAFPECCSVVFMRFDDSESSSEWAFELAGIGTSTAQYIDADGNWGEIPGDGEHGWFDVTVRVGEDCPESLDLIEWTLNGDNYGAPPHVLTGAIPISFEVVPVEETSVSALKRGFGGE